MDRRKFLIGMGSLAAGSAAAIGTGAFTRVEATRTMTITKEDDAKAFLGLEPSDGPNGEYATSGGDDIEIHIDDYPQQWGGNGHMGSGVNVQAVTQIDKIFKVTNQGTQEVNVIIDDESLEMPERITFYTGDSPSNDAIENDAVANGVTLSTGGQVFVGIEIDLSDWGAGDTPDGLEEIVSGGGYGNLPIIAQATESDS